MAHIIFLNEFFLIFKKLLCPVISFIKLRNLVFYGSITSLCMEVASIVFGCLLNMRFILGALRFTKSVPGSGIK
jgi:hypothetical protein